MKGGRIGAYSVDLDGRVARAHIPSGGVAICAELNREHARQLSGKLALDAEELGLEIDRQVVAATLTQRPQHCEAEFNRRGGGRSLGDGSLLARSEVPHASARYVAVCAANATGVPPLRRVSDVGVPTGLLTPAARTPARQGRQGLRRLPRGLISRAAPDPVPGRPGRAERSYRRGRDGRPATGALRCCAAIRTARAGCARAQFP